MNIRALRKIAKLTQKELSEAIGVSRSTIAQYELGIINIPHQTFVRLAKVLNADERDMKQEEPLGAEEAAATYRATSSTTAIKKIAEMLSRIEREQAELPSLIGQIQRKQRAILRDTAEIRRLLGWTGPPDSVR